MLNELLGNPTLWLYALVHIGLVVAYATWKNWGTMSWSFANGLYRSPGGVLAVSLPIPEMLIWLIAANITATPAALMLVGLAQHMIRVRLLLIVLFGIPALYSRLTAGKVRVMCMDHRLDSQTEHGDNFLTMHDGVCGAFVTLTLVGFMPGSLIALVLLLLGVQVSVLVMWLLVVPWLFLLGKHWHVLPHYLADTLEQLTETPGAYLSSVVLGAPTGTQHVETAHH